MGLTKYRHRHRHRLSIWLEENVWPIFCGPSTLPCQVQVEDLDALLLEELRALKTRQARETYGGGGLRKVANPPYPLLQKLLAGEQDDLGIGEEAVVENSASATFQVLPSILAPSIQKRAWHSCTIDVLRIWSRLQRRWMAHPPTPAISQISLAARGAPPKRCLTPPSPSRPHSLPIRFVLYG